MIRSERSIEAMGREENLRELVSAASDFEENGPVSYGREEWAGLDGLRKTELFLESISLVTDVDSYDDSEVVTLMTLHNAKGLEFPVVFVVGMEEVTRRSGRAGGGAPALLCRHHPGDGAPFPHQGVEPEYVRLEQLQPAESLPA